VLFHPFWILWLNLDGDFVIDIDRWPAASPFNKGIETDYWFARFSVKSSFGNFR
jgi:hypothetical protein